MKSEVGLEFSDFNRWVAFLNVFRAVHPRIEAPMIHLFLCIATYPDRTQQQYADMVGLTQTSVSRNLSVLASFKDVSLDLVSVRENPMNRRLKQVALTLKGKALLAQLKGLA